jgi:hypothetical protein
MKNEKFDRSKYVLFYSELPSSRSYTTDYPDVEIQHAYEEQSDNYGLSAEQVSLIAHDSLEKATQDRRENTESINDFDSPHSQV